MSFDHMWALNFLWILPAVWLALIFELRKKRSALAKFAENKLLSRLTGEEKKERIYLKIFLLLISMAFLITALAGPRCPEEVSGP